MPLPKILGNIFGGKAADIIDSAANVVDKFVQTKEEKEAAKLELQKVINEHTQIMEQELTKQLEVQAKENESARQREIQIATSEKAPLINKIILPILAMAVIGLAFILFYLILFRGVSVADKDILVFVLGALTTYVGSILSFYFGSSLGSAHKQNQIDKLIK